MKLRNVNFLRISSHHELEAGLELKYLLNDYNLAYSRYFDFFGRPMPPFALKRRFSYSMSGAFLNYTVKPWSRLAVTLGLRSDYSDYTDNLTFSPRAAVSMRLSDKTKLNAAAGIYYQSQPIVILAQTEKNWLFDDLVAYHAVLGIDRLLSDDTRCRVEGYYKWYLNFPMNVNEPQLFVIDEMFYNEFLHYTRTLMITGGRDPMELK